MPKTLKTKTSKIFKTKNSKICKRKNPISKEEIIKLLDKLVFRDVNLYIGFSEEPHKGLLWKTWLTNHPYGIRTQDNIRIIFPDFAVKTIKGFNIFIPTENVWMLQTDPKDYNLYLGDSSTKTLIKHSRYGYISKIKNPKLQSKKNPDINWDNITIYDVLNQLPYPKLIRSGHIEIWYFKLEKSLTLYGKRLFPGEYILKFSKSLPIINRDILLQLSRYRLIPKIYMINSKFNIMKYIKGVELKNIIKENWKWTVEQKRTIYQNILTSIQTWHKLGFFHGDIGKNGNNILVDDDTLEVYIIDPGIDHEDFRKNHDEFIKYKQEAIKWDLHIIDLLKNALEI